MGRKKGSDHFHSWSMKGLVSRFKNKNWEVDGLLVIGIDFGTTYSGAAWATVADFEAEQINLITSWPGTGREEGKAPTEIFYENDQVMWGYTIPSDANPIRWFKLLLLREEDLTVELRESEFLLRARKIIRETKKTATDLIADYLRALWQHILDTIHKARGKSVTEALTFHVVITVPAIWKDYARQSMTEAARKSGILDTRLAGLTTLAFAPEPEAAALASLYESKPSINAGDVFVICDAGGGTVDLISYEVGSVDPIELHEAVIGSGGLCGGVFIDETFELMVKDRLGRKWNKLTQNGIKDIMKNEWEYSIKPQFKLNNMTTDEYNVAIPAEAFEGSDINDTSRKPIIKNGRILFSSSDIQKAFMVPFDEIESLVDEQISKVKGKKRSVTVYTPYMMKEYHEAYGAKGIILVGGLGSSPYLYEHLKKRYGGKKIDVLQSTGIRPRTAICRGAIFKGFLEGPNVESNAGRELSPDANPISKITSPISVISTIARVSLGVKHNSEFIEGIHRENEKYWNDHLGVHQARNQMTWYLRKGDNVSKLTPTKHPWFRTYITEEQFDQVQQDIIYQCEDDDPPKRETASVKELCTINSKFGIRFDQLEYQTGKTGTRYKGLTYEIEMIPSGASNEFSVIYENQKLGSQHAHIEFQ